MILVLMGVSGAGKTTVGRLLAARLGWAFADADDFHSPENVEKIRRGIPLTDADRQPWLAALQSEIRQYLERGAGAVLACSALRRAYRLQLEVDARVHTVYLKGSHALIQERLRSRRGHFATESLLDSQFAALEEPDDALVVDIGPAPAAIASEIIRALHLQPA